jgi:nucleoside-diphosphate-sugar epimerase
MLIAGLGNTGSYIAREATLQGYKVIGTARNISRYTPPEGVDLIPFSDASQQIKECTHLVLTAPPDPTVGDPFLAVYSDELASSKSLQWIGYVSSTGVYGDRGGAVVDEDSEPAPTNDRSRRRVVVEAAWRSLAASLGVPIDFFRCGGIYGDSKYNTTFDALESGTARRIIKPGHSFPRIHIDDVAAAIAAAAQQGPAARGGAAARVLHLVDDSLNTPASEVVGYAAALLGVPPPPEEPFDAAWEGMTPLARSFWSEDVKVRNERTKERLGLALRYPTYREGYAALLAHRRSVGKHLPRV